MDGADIENREWSIVRVYLEKATPQQRHIFAARSNYDGNSKAIRWLIDNPALDRATAHLIYWYLGAAWYVQFASEDAMESYQVETFQLLKLIEQRCRNNFYTSNYIWFDPKCTDGSGPNDYPDLPVKRAIPAFMMQPTGGEDYVDLDDLEDYDDGLPIDIAKEIFALYD